MKTPPLCTRAQTASFDSEPVQHSACAARMERETSPRRAHGDCPTRQKVSIVKPKAVASGRPTSSADSGPRLFTDDEDALLTRGRQKEMQSTSTKRCIMALRVRESLLQTIIRHIYIKNGVNREQIPKGPRGYKRRSSQKSRYVKLLKYERRQSYQERRIGESQKKRKKENSKTKDR